MGRRSIQNYFSRRGTESAEKSRNSKKRIGVLERLQAINIFFLPFLSLRNLCASVAFPLVFLLTSSSCFQDDEDAMMLDMYHRFHIEIDQATNGTPIPAAYLAALISLESLPLGNRDSARFEPMIYERLLDLKWDGKSFGYMKRSEIQKYEDPEIRRLATSYGLTQIMGYHCIDLGCSVDDLKSSYHLVWAVAWMRKNYNRMAVNRNWAACFRIHNTGRPDGKPGRPDYVTRGLVRMAFYEKWNRAKGDPANLVRRSATEARSSRSGVN